MKSLFPRAALTSLALGVFATGYAQDPVPIEFYRPLKNSVSIGARMIGGNAKVKFSSLGNISSLPKPDLNGSGTRIYDNGAVGSDGPRTFEINNTDKNNDGVFDSYQVVSTSDVYEAANGDQLQNVTTQFREDRPAEGKYLVRETTTVKNLTSKTETSTDRILGEGLNYIDGVTRNWGYNQPSQTIPGPGPDGKGGTVDMSIYSVASSGAEAQAESDDSIGVELQFAHVFKRYKRFEWGMNFSAGASNINAKTRKQVRANLLTTTDRYTLRNDGKFSSGPYYDSTTDFTPVPVDTGEVDANNNPIMYEYQSENYHRLNRTPDRIRDEVPSLDAAQVDGYWQIKGAYYLLRVGPVVRIPLAKKWTISAGAGGALAYVGSRFIVDEYIELPDVSGTIRFKDEGEEKAIVGGYYADVNLERWISVRTGFFAGYSVEKMGNYTHEFAGRKADVDLGTSSGFRFGIITRF